MANIANLLKKTGKNRETQDYHAKISLHKKHKRRKIYIVVIILAIIALGYKLYYDSKVYAEYKVKETLELEQKYNNSYVKFADYLIKYSNDGISYITPEGQVWNRAFEMKTPLIDVCGSYAAIGDQKSNKIYVFNEKGFQGEMDTSYPIVKIEVANQGVVAALLEDNDANYIEVRDKEGNILITAKTVLDGNGYPIDFSLSEDGEKMVVSYLCITGGQAQTKILFYNFSEIGKNEVDRMVGGFNHYKTTIVPKVEFVTNDIAVAFGDNIFTIYSMKQKPEIIVNKEFSSEVKKVFHSDKYIGMVFYNSTSEEPFELVVYNLKGTKILSTTYTKEYTNVKFANDDILFYDDLDCRVISIQGKEKFEYTFGEEILDIIPTKSRYTYLVINGTNIQKIKLK